MSSLNDAGKKIYLIVHGQHQFVDQIKEKLVMKGFEKGTCNWQALIEQEMSASMLQ